jgi:acyl-CoA-binding protein
MSSAFEDAAEIVARDSENYPQDTLLNLYGLYKQATKGPCNTPKPSGGGMLKFGAKKAAAKWQAWSDLGTLDSKTAESRYVRLVKQATKN